MTEILLPDWPVFGTSAVAGPPGEYPVLKPSRPVRVSIPAIGVKAPVHPIGLAQDGSIGVPSLNRKNEAAWYDRSPAPGQYGPSIIVGHVDGTRGPAVFSELSHLRQGHLIEVTRRDRSVAVFRVDSVQQFDKTKIPVDKLYGDFTKPGLRLITCGGAWVGGSLGYAHNVVVFATLLRTGKT